MKKAVTLILALCMLALLTSCGTETVPGNKTSGAAAPEQSAVPDRTAAPERAVDLDLSVLSGTVVYAQVYNIMTDPDAYLGKIIRVSGYYDVYVDPETGSVYHACVIPDATACCAQGLEFVWAGSHVYPDEYSKPGTDLTVTGRLEIYQEGGTSYLHLVGADVVWKPEGNGAA